MALVKSHCVEHGSTIVASDVLGGGCRTLSVHLAGRKEVARVAFDGNVFSLSFPGGYSCTEYADDDEGRDGAFAYQLAFLDA